MSLAWTESALVTESELNGAQLVVDFELVTRRNVESSSISAIFSDSFILKIDDLRRSVKTNPSWFFLSVYMKKKPCILCDQMRVNVQLNERMIEVESLLLG